MLNNVMLNGRLVGDPELKATKSGDKYTKFRLAVERNFLQNGKRECDFIDVVAWRTTAEIVTKHFTKGDGIIVVGELRTREYSDKDGNKRKVVEVVASGINFPIGTAQKKPTKKESASDDFDEIPSEFDIIPL